MSSFPRSNITVVDFSRSDYRAFCLLLHSQYGALLLYCTQKKKKPLPITWWTCQRSRIQTAISNWQSKFVTQKQLYLSACFGCIREIDEETGIDLRKQLKRFSPASASLRSPHFGVGARPFLFVRRERGELTLYVVYASCNSLTFPNCF